MDPLPPTPPSVGGGKIAALVAAFVLLAGGLLGGILLLTQSGGDDSGGGGDETAAEPDEDPASEETPEPVGGEPSGGEPSGGEPSDRPDEPPPTTEPAALDLFADPTPFVEVMTEAVGEQAMVYEAGVYPEHGFLNVRDTDNPNRVQRFTWVNQDLMDPEVREPFPGTDLDTDTFPLRSIAFDRIPLLVRRAPERVGIADGHVTHILMDRAFTQVPTMRIYVSSADDVESDYALATLDGRFTTR